MFVARGLPLISLTIPVVFLAGCFDGVSTAQGQVARFSFEPLASYSVEQDKTVIDAVIKFYEDKKTDAAFRNQVSESAKSGGAPPLPDEIPGPSKYRWVELGNRAVRAIHLQTPPKDSPRPNAIWQKFKEARENAAPLVHPLRQWLIFSRQTQNTKLTPQERDQKQFDYFILVRAPQEELVLNEKHLLRVSATFDEFRQPVLVLAFTPEGANRLKAVSAKRDYIAVILANRILDLVFFDEPLDEGVMYVSGRYTRDDVEKLVLVLTTLITPQNE